MAKQYSTDNLQAGDVFVVVGYTSYPRLTHVLEGEELQDEIKRATQQGRIPTTVPHTYTTLVDAQIEYRNPQAPTLAELYAAERLYTNKDGKVCYTAVRKNATLPEFGVVDPQDYTKVQGIYLDPEKTLANGLLVKCYFRIYDTKAGMHKGVSLDTIIFQEPVKYYEFSNAADQLAQRGLTWTPAVGEPPTYNPVTPAFGANQAAPAPMAPNYGAPQAAPQMAPQAAPMPQPNYGAPAPQAAPMPQPNYGAPAPVPAPQMAPQAAPQAAPMPQPNYGAPAPQMAPQAAPMPQPNYGAPAPQAAPQMDPYAGNGVPQQTIGNTGAGAFDNAYTY